MGWEWGPNRKEQPCLRGGFEVWLDLGLTSCGRERKNEELLMTLEVYHLGISEMVAAFTKLRLYKEDRVGERETLRAHCLLPLQSEIRMTVEIRLKTPSIGRGTWQMQET